MVKTETSKIDDSTNVFLKLTSADEISNQYGARSHLDLFVTCPEKKTDVYITFGGYFMSSLNDSGVVTYRVDKKPTTKKSVEESNDHMALGLWFMSASVPFIKSLFGGSTLFVRAIPYDANAVTAEFNIAGIEDAIKPLRAACRW